jgi:hypothetical protein
VRVRLAAIVGVLIGGALIPIGLAAGLLPLIGRRPPCAYSIRPPAEFEAAHLEGISSVGPPEISLFPFGAQCTYLAKATGETATSVLSLWPTAAILGGFTILLVSVAGVLATSRHARRRPA